MANREAATKVKELGNAAYKKKDFNSAISHYTKVSPRVFFLYPLCSPNSKALSLQQYCGACPFLTASGSEYFFLELVL